MKTKLTVNAGNILFMTLLLMSFFTLSYCNDQARENMDKSLKDFREYVREHKESAEKYADQRWDEMEKEYNQKKTQLDRQADKMDKEMKKNYEETLADWESFKNDYSMRAAEKEHKEKADMLKTRLMPADINTDMANITGENIARVYEHFVNAVDKDRDAFTKEEWININNYWQSLNNIKNRLDESSLVSSADNRKITGYKIKYTAIKAINKPFAESENS